MEKEKQKEFEKGTLYICATPIGNLKDITLRALECLQTVDLIAVEKVERSRKLLSSYGISAPLLSYREANRKKSSTLILNKLKEGARVALITDAGMPVIADPGHYLLELLVEEGVPYTVLPGPSAALTALVLSAYPCKRFVFMGFLERKKSGRRKELEALLEEEKAVIMYESPHRLLKTLQEMQEIFGSREVAVCRELTKMFEEIKRGAPVELINHYRENPPRGEVTMVLAPLAKELSFPKRLTESHKAVLEESIRDMLMKEIENGSAPGAVVKKTASFFSLPRNEVYAIFLRLKKQGLL